MNIRPGRLEVITGPMFSGKTEELIRRIQRLGVAGIETMAFKPSLDDRYSSKNIVTHSGVRIKARDIKYLSDLVNYIGQNNGGAYAFDEVQFFEDGVVDIIDEELAKGKIIIASGLNQDFAGRPFKFRNSDRNIGELLAMADDVSFLTAICTYIDDGGIKCNGEATRTQRLVDGRPANIHGDLIVIGGKDRYEARCEKHHFLEYE